MNLRDDDAADAAGWELEVERFACGEMLRADEDVFLARCESEPDRWRSVALACVEHRRLANVLRSGQPREAVRPQSSTCHGVHRRSSGRPFWAAAAAIGLIAVGASFGYRLGQHRGPQPQVANVALARPATPIDEKVAQQLSMHASPLLPRAAAKVLRDAGIDVHEEPIFYLLDGSDGDRWVVPETQLQLRLVGRNHEQP